MYQIVELSHVLLGPGYGEDQAHSSIRVGIGRFNTEEEIGFTTNKIVSVVKEISKITA